MTELQKEEIKRMREEGLGYSTIGRKLGMTKDCIKAYCRTHDLGGIRSDVVRAADINQDHCLQCGAPLKFGPIKRKKRFCSDRCRHEWWKRHPEKATTKDSAWYSFTCLNCGKDFRAYGNSKRRYCSHNCYVTARFHGGQND